jgi:hypothetical protein
MLEQLCSRGMWLVRITYVAQVFGHIVTLAAGYLRRTYAALAASVWSHFVTL